MMTTMMMMYDNSHYTLFPLLAVSPRHNRPIMLTPYHSSSLAITACLPLHSAAHRSRVLSVVRRGLMKKIWPVLVVKGLLLVIIAMLRH